MDFFDIILFQIFEFESQNKLDLINHYVDSFLLYGNVTVVGWQNIVDEDGNTDVRTVEFTIFHGDTPVVSIYVLSSNVSYLHE